MIMLMCLLLQFPTHHTLLLPDYSSTHVTNIVHAVLGQFCFNQHLSQLSSEDLVYSFIRSRFKPKFDH